jgi:DNA-directed RNA polymerase subunit RPC12/RpoP
MQCTRCGAELQPGATVCPSCEQRVVLSARAVATPRAAKATAPDRPAKPPKPARAPKIRDESEPPAWVRPVAIAIAAVVVLAGIWFVYSLVTTGANTPDAAAVRFLQAYANYDAKGMLDNSTHSSFTTTDLATFQREMANAPADVKSRPLYKDIKVVSVTIEPTDPNTAIVRLSAQMLDTIAAPASAASTSTAPVLYSPRDEVLTVVNTGGKWLVKWN